MRVVDVMPTARRQLWFLLRFIGLAAAAGIGAIPLMFIAFLLLLTAFMEHGPTGPIEPEWVKTTASYGSLAFTSGLAAFLYTDATQANWRSNLLLGLSSGVIAQSTWLIYRLASGDPFSAYCSWMLVLPPTIGALGSLLGGALRRGGLRDDPYRWT
jgi:hypothetical protein